MYNEFAYFYDVFNGEADYKRLHRCIKKQFRRLGVRRGAVVADLGCGTGTLTLALARDGYELLAVDVSEDMLNVLGDKLAAKPRLAGRVQLLRQDLTQLDLFGTVQGAVASFDVLDHIGPLPRFAAAVRRAALFMDKDAVFIFDMNTPYKHKTVLDGQSYTVRSPFADCEWSAVWRPEKAASEITVRTFRHDPPESFEERFIEYSYTPQQVCEACDACGLQVLQVLDGERFGELRQNSQRMLFITQKRYTQNVTE